MAVLSPSSRRLRGLALAGCVAVALPVAAAAPAGAQSAPAPATSDRAGATSAQALLLRVGLPAVVPGLPATPYLLELAVDPVSGTVRRVGSSSEAQASATVLAGSLLGQGLDTGRAVAQLPSPTESSVDPAAALAEALDGTPLEGLLTIELLPAKAAVTDGPTSTSQATVARIAVGLPADVAGLLAPLTGGLAAAVDTLIGALAEQVPLVTGPLCDNIPAVADALELVTEPIDDVLGGLLGVQVGTALNQVVSITLLEAVCGLDQALTAVGTALSGALTSLAGEGGVLDTGVVESSQSITNDGDAVRATATASVAGLTVLGQSPFATAGVLRSTATAVANGQPGGADARVESTVLGLQTGAVDPFLALRVNLEGIFGEVLTADLPPALEDSLAGLIAQLNAVLGLVGVVVTPNSAAPGFDGCPTALAGQEGTYEAPDGACAAASTDGLGVTVVLPAALNDLLGLGGAPLLSLEVASTGAVAKIGSATTTTTTLAGGPFSGPLPRTGAEGLLAVAGLVLLGGAVAVRRARG